MSAFSGAPGAAVWAAAVLGWFLVGAFVWTFFEYVLHRFAFHEMRGRNLGSREHLEHHVKAQWGFDPVILLAWAGVMLGGWGLGALGAWALGPAGWGLGAGWTVGYFFYEYHHAQSHLRGPKNRWERWLRINHFHHHFGHPLSNQGVTIPLWDIVFGTLERPERVKVPRRLVMRWLCDEDGEIRPEYRADYELVGSSCTGERQVGIDRARAFANLVPHP
jgi:sterol desaturase/sphingolipid hydroxylase (fatty acid hydroxylase superfamily)